MTSKSLTWTGDAVIEKMRRAEIVGVNATMGAAVKHAKANHPWKNRTGILEGAINILGYAAPTGTGVEGHWGVNDAVQARILELGGVIKPKNAKALAIPDGEGGVRYVASVTIPAYPYLRPAGDEEYPALIQRIRRAYEKEGGDPADVQGQITAGGGDV